ncbi:MAG: exopolysaccharide biosynthesis polyprenyl glycosylphosphotransferase [Verrucomicrobia bacterium]|nr:exopolysaccharide biosynthesis polyprenyl glycosylphosphotransferase [Verrucomicrobiota bacterium]
MIEDRVRGIGNLTTACQCLIVLVVFWLWLLIYSEVTPGGEGINLGSYGGYGLLIALGLVLESLLRDRSNPLFPVRRSSIIPQIPRAFRQTAVAVGFLLFVLVLSKDRYLSRLFLFSLIPALYVALLYSGHTLPQLLARRLFCGKREERMILIGSPKRANKIRDWLLAKRQYGFHPVGILTNDANQPNAWPKILGTPGQLDAFVTEHGVTQVILLQLPEATSGFDEVLNTVQKRGLRLAILSNLEEQLQHSVFSFEDDGLKFFAFHHEPLENPLNRIVKRVLDLAIALPCIIIFLPAAAIFVKIAHCLQSPGPLFLRQTRAGIQNRKFEILKFRTMHVSNQSVATSARGGDTRIFPLGQFFRRASIDEIPQFLNVLSGKMSVVGPRPHLIEHNHKFAELLVNYHIRAFVKPGMTGLAQVRGFRGEAITREAIAARLQSDLVYLEKWSLILDFSIILRTCFQVIFPPETAC